MDYTGRCLSRLANVNGVTQHDARVGINDKVDARLSYKFAEFVF